MNKRGLIDSRFQQHAIDGVKSREQLVGFYFTGLSQNGLSESGSMVVRKKISPNSQLPQYWSEGSEIASIVK